MPSRLADQEFVAHLFAPIEGPDAAAAAEGIAGLWVACRDQLEMSEPIAGTDLPVVLPADVPGVPDGALAGLQDRAVNFQAIVRREHDVLNFSLVMATPADQPRRRLSSAVAPPGWPEFTRWWRALTARGLGPLLGGATVHLAKAGNGSAADVRDALPPQDDDAASWWTRDATVDGFPFWEVTPAGDRAMRRLVLLGRKAEDARLSRLTWSAGGVALPPLGRYLMHAAKMRYQARVRGDGSQLHRVRNEVERHLDELVGLLRGPADPARVAAAADGLRADEAGLAATLAGLGAMRRTVEIARSNMTTALPDVLPADVAFGALFHQQLLDDAHYLEETRLRAERTRQIAESPAARRPEPPAPARKPEPAAEPRVEQRISFGIDVVKYSDRTVPQQRDVQRRLFGMVGRVLGGIGLKLADTDRQDAGDGMMVVLPPGLEAHVVLPGLLHGWRTQTVADNGEHPDDRIRLRLSVAAGPFAAADIGFTGHTIIETGRLLDSRVLREAVTGHPDADVVAVITDRLHQDVIREGYPGLDAGQFERVEVEVKTFRAVAWVWTGSAAPPVATEPPPTEPPSTELPSTELPPTVLPTDQPSGRDVFVIHGSDGWARTAMFDFLRAIGLHPLEWDELINRTGSPAPRRDDVLTSAFADNAAAIVLVTAADGVRLMIEAGMALGRQPDRTVLVEVGTPGELTGQFDREALHIDGTEIKPLLQLAQRLRLAGCAVRTDGSDWLNLDRFKAR